MAGPLGLPCAETTREETLVDVHGTAILEGGSIPPASTIPSDFEPVRQSNTFHMPLNSPNHRHTFLHVPISSAHGTKMSTSLDIETAPILKLAAKA